jgi:predicted RNA binding protein YcfA (HicA-like mRNA interferase family)
MKAISGKQLTRIVEQKGWTLLRTAGSHHIYGKQGSVVRLSIPVHGNRPLKIGLQRHLMKMAGLSDSDLTE